MQLQIKHLSKQTKKYHILPVDNISLCLSKDIHSTLVYFYKAVSRYNKLTTNYLKFWKISNKYFFIPICSFQCYINNLSLT